MRVLHVNYSEAKPDFNTKSSISSYRDRARLASGSNTAKQATLAALLHPSTHFRPPLTHTSHHRPAPVDLSRSIAVSGVSHSRFRRFSTCISAVSGVSLIGFSLLSAVTIDATTRTRTHHAFFLFKKLHARANYVINPSSLARARSLKESRSIASHTLRFHACTCIVPSTIRLGSYLRCLQIRRCHRCGFPAGWVACAHSRF